MLMSHANVNPLQRARRMAQRSRAAAACLPCKASKTRCNDYRPCARCKKAGIPQQCMDPQLQQKSASSDMVRLSSTSSMIGCAFDGSATLPFSNASYFYQPAPRALTCASLFPATGHPKDQYSLIDAMHKDLAHGRYWEPSRIGGASPKLELVQV